MEINIDVYLNRKKDLVERTDDSYVPHIFFNEKLFGGLVALNSLRSSGGSKCPYGAPPPLVYGFDDLDKEELPDQMMGIFKVLRLKLPIQDRLMKMKIVKNYFAGSEMVKVLIQHLDCGHPTVYTRPTSTFFTSPPFFLLHPIHLHPLKNP
ncbi:hypothetical protein C1H46_014986 [Malus baccata]|uniref:Uncharacterized protein n=1 Tax=Malus baccata TaxID=106549 RepID=A0A540MKU6_MALBA|nr:hypothetical protein C1H46_014986 [Malus baccata]